MCLIPARSGSSLKDKNIRKLCGKPLIGWAIEAAKVSGIHHKIVVSTDSNKIADVAISCGADEIWWRPKELSSDNAHIMDAVSYHLNERGSEEWDYVQLHHATAPLVTGIDILKAAKFMLCKEADFVISMCPSDTPLGVAKPLSEDCKVNGWFPKAIRCLNRQELETPYQLDNNIYMGKYEIFRDKIDYWETNIYAYKMSLSKYCEIHDETDFQIARCKLEERSHGPFKSLLSRL